MDAKLNTDALIQIETDDEREVVQVLLHMSPGLRAELNRAAREHYKRSTQSLLLHAVRQLIDASKKR